MNFYDLDHEALVYMMYIFLSLHGILNAVFYIYINRRIRDRLKYIILCQSDQLSFLGSHDSNLFSVLNAE